MGFEEFLPKEEEDIHDSEDSFTEVEKINSNHSSSQSIEYTQYIGSHKPLNQTPTRQILYSEIAREVPSIHG